jgi:hypothetical protein
MANYGQGKVKPMNRNEKNTRSDKAVGVSAKTVGSSAKKATAISEKSLSANQFAGYRKRRGAIIRGMREKRKISQEQIGLPARTVGRFENGELKQILIMDLLLRIAPCPREMLKLFRNMIESLPITCIKCRAQCKYRGLQDSDLSKAFCGDITLDPL